jgi:hypothetical protein
MYRKLLVVSLILLLAGAGVASAFTVSGSVTGGVSSLLQLKYVYGIPTTLDTIYIAIAIPFLNTYSLNNLREGSYMLFAFQDQDTNFIPSLDEPRGFYGGTTPLTLDVASNLTGINIALLPPENGGFSGTVSYSGSNRGATIIAAFDNTSFTGTARGAGVVLDTTGTGDYIAVVDTFGVYYAYAFMDLNLNFTYDADEPYGFYGTPSPSPITVAQSNFPNNINITLNDPSASPEAPLAVPKNLSLISVYPNPFNSMATVLFSIGAASPVELVAYDLLGREALRSVAGTLAAGEHHLTLNGAPLSSGVYLIRLSASAEVQMTKVLLLK